MSTSQANLPVELTQNDHHQIAQLLKDLSREQLLDLVPALGLSYTRFRGKEEHLLGDIISGWLRMEDGVVTTPCWAVMITALEEIGQNGIATKIRQTFSGAAEEEISRPPSSILPSPDTQAQAFSDGTAVSASCLQAKFPYLNTEHLSQEGKNILIGRLEAESKGIEQKFAALVIATAKSLEARRITVERVIVLLKSCGITFEPTAEYRNIDHVLITAIDHWSFFNYRNLEALIECVGDDADRERLAIYKSDFKEYCKRRLCEVPIDALRSDRTVTTRLHIKMDRHWNIPVEDVYLLAKVLSDLLDTTLLLLNVEEGCIKIDFDCRYLEEDELLPLLSDGHKDVFMQLGITKLYTDRQVFYEQHDPIKELEKSDILKVQSGAAATIRQKVLEKPLANGLAVIVTNDYSNTGGLEELRGTIQDGSNLSAAFASLKFIVHWKINVSKDSIQEVVDYLKQLNNETVKNYCCIVFAFAGRGSENNHLHMQDGQTLNLYTEIVAPLLPESAPDIGAIPKVFLIDACRGSEITPSTLVPRSSDKQRAASQGGFLLVYSTLPSCKSFEKTGQEGGGIWLSKLATEIRKGKHLESFVHILVEVIDEVEKEMQHPDSFQQPEFLNRVGNICLDPQTNQCKHLNDGEDSDVEKDVKKKHSSEAQVKPNLHNVDDNRRMDVDDMDVEVDGVAALIHGVYLDDQARRVIEKLPADDLNLTRKLARKLTLKELPYMRVALITVSCHWYSIGIHFGQTVNDLDNFRVQYKKDADKCLTSVIAEWLINGRDPTWMKVIIAVASHVGGDNPARATEIATEIIKGVHHSTFEGLDEVDGRELASDPAIVRLIVDHLMDGVAVKWDSVGLFLGILYHRIEFCKSEADTLEQKVTMMVDMWLSRKYDTDTFGLPSWRKLVEAVAAPSGGGHCSLASEIAQRHPADPPQPVAMESQGSQFEASAAV